ncbi:Endoglucanase [Arthrobotrys entomopaga]|nr:Endoglucanase [Arthrobotrys entomopaga]
MTTAEVPPHEAVPPIMPSKRFAILLGVSFLFLAGLVPYIIYRNILYQNHFYAPLDSYPSPDKIAEKLHCPGRTNTTAHEFLEKRAPLFKLPLRTKGRNIVDASGERVKLMSVNWYGASDEDFIVGGLDHKHRREIATTIREMGFNSVRLPYSDELVMRNPDVPEKFWSKNPDLLQEKKLRDHAGDFKRELGQNILDSQPGRQDNDNTEGGDNNSTFTVKALDLFDAVVKALTDEGIAVIINDHITQARWCCDGNLCDATWSNEYLGKVCRITLTEEQWMQNWEKVMRPYVDNPLVIGADLRNENRSPLGKILWDSWATAAERAAIRLHALQPDWLMFVEGVASSNYLQGVRTRPINLPIPNRVVYSAHVYGWSGWGSLLKGPYWSRDYASFAYDMYDNWGFLLEENIAPVWVGEFGAPDKPNTGDLNYWTNLMNFLQDVDADWGYWAINPRKPKDNETESYSLVQDDWATPKCDYRMYDLMTKLGLSPYNSTELAASSSSSTSTPARTLRPAVPGNQKQIPLGI